MCGEKKLKIGHYLAKVCAKVCGLLFRPPCAVYMYIIDLGYLLHFIHILLKMN